VGLIRNDEADGGLTSPYTNDGSLTLKPSRGKHPIRTTAPFRSLASGSRTTPTHRPQAAPIHVRRGTMGDDSGPEGGERVRHKWNVPITAEVRKAHGTVGSGQK